MERGNRQMAASHHAPMETGQGGQQHYESRASTRAKRGKFKVQEEAGEAMRMKPEQAAVGWARQQPNVQGYVGLWEYAALNVEPLPSGNLPPGFNSLSCRSVYVGNLHHKVTEQVLADYFSSVGQIECLKLIKKGKSSYGFIDYYDHRSAAAAILSLNAKPLFNQPIKVNWAYASGQREDTTGHFNIFVGDLGPEITDATLFQCFSANYPSCSDARVMWDQKSGRSRGFGFVSFRNQQESERAIVEMHGKWLGSRALRCNRATKTAEPEDTAMDEEGEGPESTGKAGPSSSQGDDRSVPGERPEDNPNFTTVYVGNLAQEVTQHELHRQFHSLGAGVLEDVRVQRGQGFGFVRYRTHEEAAVAIQAANGRVICGKSVKCSWGSKPTPPGLQSSPLPPPPPPPPTYNRMMSPGMAPPFTGGGGGPMDYVAYQYAVSPGTPGRGIIPMPLRPQVSMPMGLTAVPINMASMGLGMSPMGQSPVVQMPGPGGRGGYDFAAMQQQGQPIALSPVFAHHHHQHSFY